MTCQLNHGEMLTVALPNGDKLIIDCRDPDYCVPYFVDSFLVDVFYPDRNRPPIPKEVIQ